MEVKIPRKTNKELVNERAKQWYQENREEVLKKNKERYELRKETPEFKEQQQQHYLQNKDEILRKNKLWKEANEEKYKATDRRGHLRRTYGISLEQYEELLDKQNGSCFVCERPQHMFNLKLAVDHDHKTGEIRGLLCSHCNQKIIGRERRPEIFKRAAQYLEGPFTQWFVPEKKKKKRRRIRKNSKQVLNSIDTEDLE